MHHVAVVRGSLQNPEIAIIDYKRVIRGEAQDIPLQPHDIVYVPFSPYRYLQRYAELILNTLSSASTINAGSSLFANKAKPALQASSSRSAAASKSCRLFRRRHVNAPTGISGALI